MYITPAQLAERPGARELAQVATRERDAIVVDDLMDATLRGTDRAAWTADQVAIADDALARINEAIDGAAGVIDGFLARRYPLPLAVVSPIVVEWSRSITRYLLHKDRISSDKDDPILRDYRDAQKMLQLTADGKFSLGADDPVLADTEAADVQFTGDGRVFRRDPAGRYP
ncbi:gp436 family protein [Rhodanobacter ginsengisoli]|uniref:Gp436 family protein n=1 Tax=Rhodanobacter ginsengisoli TaxID=418646 RepID=A0ABW0QJT0_9GAMM